MQVLEQNEMSQIYGGKGFLKKAAKAVGNAVKKTGEALQSASDWCKDKGVTVQIGKVE